MIPSYYEFYNPVKIISGHKALETLPHELKQLGSCRPIIVTDKGVVKAGLVELVKKAFGSSGMTIGAIYDDVPPDSSCLVVNDIARVFRQNDCDSLIAVGGGSAVDTAKGVNIVVTEESDDLMKFMGADILQKPMKPLLVIPTTSGTGSEVTLVAVISNPQKNIKMVFTSPHLLPKVAILDPRMTLTLPPLITAATGMDALTHAIEAYTCLQKNPLSDAYAQSAIKLIRKNLLNAVKKGNKADTRLAMANASTMAGTAFSNSMVGMVHSLGHATGGVCHVPHGVAMSIFLPHGLGYNLEKNGHYTGELLLPLGGSELFASTPLDKRPDKTIALIRDIQQKLFELCKLPLCLKDADVPKDKLGAIARAAISDGSIIMNPEEMDFDDAMEVLQRAW